MKSSVWIILIFSTITAGLQAGANNQNDRNKMDLKGPVQSLRESSYSAIKGRNGEILKGERVIKTRWDVPQDDFLFFDLHNYYLIMTIEGIKLWKTTTNLMVPLKEQ